MAVNSVCARAMLTGHAQSAAHLVRDPCQSLLYQLVPANCFLHLCQWARKLKCLVHIAPATKPDALKNAYKHASC